jgi:hypothetical protein
LATRFVKNRAYKSMKIKKTQRIEDERHACANRIYSIVVEDEIDEEEAEDDDLDVDGLALT